MTGVCLQDVEFVLHGWAISNLIISFQTRIKRVRNPKNIYLKLYTEVTKKDQMTQKLLAFLIIRQNLGNTRNIVHRQIFW